MRRCVNRTIQMGNRDRWMDRRHPRWRLESDGEWKIGLHGRQVHATVGE